MSEKEGGEVTYRPRDCPRRSALCHGTCQRYLKAHIRHTLLDMRAERRASEARAFYAEDSARQKRSRR
ncbi:MAG: hypothetical protein ACLSD3_13000 [Acutalibacteraceae bacterium]